MHTDTELRLWILLPQLAQVLLHDAKQHLFHLHSRSPLAALHPASFFLSPHSRPDLQSYVPVVDNLHPDPALVCANPAPFPTLPPTSRPLTSMSLADSTKRVVEQFEFSDAEINRHVQEFLRQMGTFPSHDNS